MWTNATSGAERQWRHRHVCSCPCRNSNVAKEKSGYFYCWIFSTYFGTAPLRPPRVPTFPVNIPLILFSTLSLYKSTVSQQEPGRVCAAARALCWKTEAIYGLFQTGQVCNDLVHVHREACQRHCCFTARETLESICGFLVALVTVPVHRTVLREFNEGFCFDRLWRPFLVGTEAVFYSEVKGRGGGLFWSRKWTHHTYLDPELQSLLQSS